MTGDSPPKLCDLHAEFILCFRSALSDEKRRLDSKISELEEELEEERAQNEMLMEKAKRSQLLVDYFFLRRYVGLSSSRNLKIIIYG